MKKIGRYEVERELGRGAMGVVYLAFDPRVRRQVAIKTCNLPPDLPPEQKAEFGQRFIREAHAAGGLIHPAIVIIHDADEDPETKTPYIVMEYVEGRTLKEILASESRLPLERSLEAAIGVAQALSEAHEAGIVHRDIKPANILISAKSGAVKIADFGIARITSSEMTQSGGTLGSPAYMSPEQIRGKKVDPRSDLFSLGVVLYEALCGKRPFEGPDLTALAFAVVHETHTPISRVVEGLPRSLDRFFDRVLCKEPEGRFKSAAELSGQLEGILDAARRQVGNTLSLSDSEGTLVESHGARSSVDVSGKPVAEADRTLIETGEGASGDEVIEASPEADRTLIEAEEPGATDHGREAAASGAPATSAGAGEKAATGRPVPLSRRRIIQVAAGILVSIAALTAWNAWRYGATLIIKGENKLESGHLSLVVDGETVFQRVLQAERKPAKIFGRTMFEFGEEEFEASVPIRAGRVHLLAQLHTEEREEPYEDDLTVDVERGQQLQLKVRTGGRMGNKVSIDAD